MRKKSFYIALACLLLCGGIVTPAQAVTEPPSTSATAHILMDMDSGQVLCGANMDQQMRIASLTKVMTALVVLDHCDPEALVEIQPEYTGIEGSSIYLQAGEQLTVRTLLYGLLLHSGNDAATALACYTAGSEAAFAQWMNEKAQALGLTGTSFENPHGLDGDNHYSTAYDMAKIMQAAMQNKTFAEITGTKTITIGGRTFTNHNKLLWNCDGVIGGKTGYTQRAGRTLVSCATRWGTNLICVTLNDGNDWADHAALYDWGFSAYSRQQVIARGTSYGEVCVVSGASELVQAVAMQDLYLLVTEEDTVEVQVSLPAFLYAVVEKGAVLGTAEVYVNGKQAGSVDLVAQETVEIAEGVRLTTWEKLKRAWYLANLYGPIGYTGG